MKRPSVTNFQATRENVGDPSLLAEMLNRIQQVLVGALVFLFGLPLNQGHSLITGIALTTSATVVRHALGRPINGFIVVRSTAQATVIDATTATPSDTVNLTASAATTVSLLFF